MHLSMFSPTRGRAGIHQQLTRVLSRWGGVLILFDIEGAPQGRAIWHNTGYQSPICFSKVPIARCEFNHVVSGTSISYADLYIVELLLTFQSHLCFIHLLFDLNFKQLRTEVTRTEANVEEYGGLDRLEMFLHEMRYWISLCQEYTEIFKRAKIDH